MEDADLVEAARTGHPFGFPAIFDRHAARVHDLALAMLRDRRAALEVVESAFLEAGLRLHGLAEEHRLAVWLLAVTRRHGALRDEWASGGDWRPSLPDDYPGRAQLGALVWEAVAELPLRDRTLLDLELRQGLEDDDLADALGLGPGQTQELKGRIHDLEGGLRAYLVARGSDGACHDLAKLLRGWDRRFAAADPRGLAGHVEGCPVCAPAAAALPPPFSLYRAALPAAYPLEVRDRVLDRVVIPAAATRGGDEPPEAPPAPPPEAAPDEFRGAPPPPPPRSSPLADETSRAQPPSPGPADPRSIASSAFQRSAPALNLTRSRQEPGPRGDAHAPAEQEGQGSPPAPLLVLKLLPTPAPTPHAPAEPPEAGPESAPGPAPPPAPEQQQQPPPPARTLDPGPPAGTNGSGSSPPQPPAAPIPAGPTAAPAEGWLANGFPPPSFTLDAAPTGRRASPGRLRWLAGAAVLAAVLLLVGALVIATRGDDETALTSGGTTTSSVPDATSVLDATTVPTETPGPAVVPAPAATAPGGTGRAVAPATAPPTTAAPRPGASSGQLAVSNDSLRLPRVDSTAGTQSGTVPLRNTGGSPLSYVARSSVAGLRVDRPSGTIAPGAATELTVTLDGTGVREGEFSGTLTFEGSGGTRQVTVKATVGRPPTIKDDAGESCAGGASPCSKLIKLAPGAPPNATPCNTPWRYSITVEDESGLKSVRADDNMAGPPVELRNVNGNRWESDYASPVPLNTALAFSIEAVDTFDFFRSRTVRLVEC